MWAEVEGIEAELLSDVERGEARALDVPIDSRRAVERALKEHEDQEFTVRFVPSIVDLEDWLDARRTEGATAAEIANDVALDAVTEWHDPGANVTYVASQARDIEHMSAPVARAAARRLWDGGKVPHGFAANAYRERRAWGDAKMETEGFEVFGGEPFVSDAVDDPRSYFVECYSSYMVQPYVLRTTDSGMYDWLSSEVFGGREFMARGGIK